MKVCGIIAEFNPLHNAHAHVLANAGKLAPDGVVVVLSGNYVQRGSPAVMNKWLRTEAALRCGADLVIELPVVLALAPAPVSYTHLKSSVLIFLIACLS